METPILIKPSFEESYPVIERLLNQRKHKWQLKAIAWMDWDDVSQIIKLHIFNKWEKYDPTKPLANWISTIISNQFINILRNVYFSKARPCLQYGGCYFNLGDDGCGFTDSKKQCSECPIYKTWEKKKKAAHDINLPVTQENHVKEIFNLPSKEYDYDAAEIKFHAEMKRLLKPNEFKVYKMLYIENLSETQVAEAMNWRTKERHRKPGYGNLIRLKKLFLQKAKFIKENTDLF